VSAGSVVAEILVSTVREALDLSRELDEAERAEIEAAIEQVRALVDEIPVRTGPGGTWTRDTEERLTRGEPEDDQAPPASLDARLARLRRAIDEAPATTETRRELRRVLDAEVSPQPPPQPYSDAGSE
jgi:hypothetical protein